MTMNPTITELKSAGNKGIQVINPMNCKTFCVKSAMFGSALIGVQVFTTNNKKADASPLMNEVEIAHWLSELIKG